MKPSTFSKVLLTIMALAFAVLVASAQSGSVTGGGPNDTQTSPLPKGAKVHTASTDEAQSLSISIRPSIQQDLDAIQKTLQEINAPDYVKDRTQVLNDQFNQIIFTLVKNDPRCDSLKVLPLPEGLQYSPGKIIVNYKK